MLTTRRTHEYLSGCAPFFVDMDIFGLFVGRILWEEHMMTREELVQAVKDASDAFYAADDTKDYYYNAYVIADAALIAYDKEI